MTKKRLFKITKWFFGILFGLMLTITVLLAVFKDEICGLVIQEINKHLKVEVEVGEVDLAFWGSFPNLSVDFKDVFIQDAYIGATKKDTLLFSERIRLKFNPLDIWKENYTVKSIEVNPGTLQLKINSKGENNFDVLKETADSTETGKMDLELKKIEFDDFRFSFANNSTHQNYKTFLDNAEISGSLSDDKFTASLESQMTILKGQSNKVTLIRNKAAQINLSVIVDQIAGTVEIPESAIEISNLPFKFSGSVQKNSYRFNLHANNIGLADLANNLALKESGDIRNYQGKGMILFNLDINGKNESNAPTLIDCKFGVQNGFLKHPESGTSISSIRLDGFYSNGNGSGEEILSLKNCSFSTSAGNFTGNLALTNFAEPRYSGNANGAINLAVLRNFVSLESVDELDGTARISTDFVVQTHHNSLNKFSIEKCNGNVNFQNASFRLKEDKRHCREIFGTFFLNDDQAGAENITCKIGSSDFRINGVFRNLSDYFNKSGEILADVEVNSNNIELADLGTQSKEEKIQGEKEYVLPDNVNGSVYLNVKKMNYEGHDFSNLAGNLKINRRLLHFSSLSLTNGGADINGSLSVHENNPENFILSSQLFSNNIDIKKVFKEWNDFQQNVITQDNISGNAVANVAFEAQFDFRNGINPKSILAQVGLQIDNGRLTNVQTMKSITESLRTSGMKYAIGKENINSMEKKLLDIRFKQLKNTIIVKDGVLTIPAMSIESSALDLEASGKHTFDNKIDYRFGFRFRDLKEPKDSEFGEVVDDGTGIRVFMHMYGDLNNPTIEWDKQSRKDMSKENREEAKKDAKSILKSEFGLFKNDTTVKTYIPDNLPKEKIHIQFDPVNGADTLIESRKPKKDSKLKNKLNALKEESEQGKKETFSIGE